MYRINQFKWVNKTGAIEKAFNYFQPSVRYTLDDITELPEAVVPPPQQTELGNEQRRIYDRPAQVFGDARSPRVRSTP